ncbi:hypothetical protein Goshw_021817, partial [Gossypium schwendimanii]|nr:hypothetical protein [Gossypium schwendimanii]
MTTFFVVCLIILWVLNPRPKLSYLKYKAYKNLASKIFSR